MDTSHTTIKSQLSTLEHQVDTNRKLFENFRAYTNLHLSNIYDQFASIENPSSAATFNQGAHEARMTEISKSITALEARMADMAKKIKPGKAMHDDCKESLRLTSREVLQLKDMLRRYMPAVDE